MSTDGRAQPVYRAFFLDREGRVFQALILTAGDDEEATREASALINANGLLVYERARFIAELPARGINHPL